MAQGIKKCKVCGKEYQYCKTWTNSGVFRWKDVACSPACAAIYFKKVEEARSKESNADEDKAVESERTEIPEATGEVKTQEVYSPKKKFEKYKKNMAVSE